MAGPATEMMRLCMNQGGEDMGLHTMLANRQTERETDSLYRHDSISKISDLFFFQVGYSTHAHEK